LLLGRPEGHYFAAAVGDRLSDMPHDWTASGTSPIAPKICIWRDIIGLTSLQLAYQKYITYCIVRGGPSHVRLQVTCRPTEHFVKFTCGLWDMRARTDRHTDIQTQRSQYFALSRIPAGVGWLQIHVFSNNFAVYDDSASPVRCSVKLTYIRRRFLFTLIFSRLLYSLINITLIKINDYKSRSQWTNICFGDGQRSLPTAVRTARQNGDEKLQPSWRPSERAVLDGRPCVASFTTSSDIEPDVDLSVGRLCKCALRRYVELSSIFCCSEWRNTQDGLEKAVWKM